MKVNEKVGVLAAVPVLATGLLLSSLATAGGHFPACASADSDSDNDGYGWENDATCIVVNGGGNNGGGNGGICSKISHSDLTHALEAALSSANGGLDFAMWATLVDRSGTVCHVTRADALNGDDPWPGSRVISAQKANTANAFSNRQLALSTANLYSAVQPGGSLFGLQESNPVDTSVAYRGNASHYGTSGDAMAGGKIGGVNVFGGGVAIYYDGNVVGAIGVSGDTSCADHNIAWKTREALGAGYTPSGNSVGGVGPGGTDDIIFDSSGGDGNGMTDGFEHAENCPGAPLDSVPNVSGS